MSNTCPPPTIYCLKASVPWASPEQKFPTELCTIKVPDSTTYCSDIIYVDAMYKWAMISYEYKSPYDLAYTVELVHLCPHQC